MSDTPSLEHVASLWAGIDNRTDDKFDLADLQLLFEGEEVHLKMVDKRRDGSSKLVVDLSKYPETCAPVVVAKVCLRLYQVLEAATVLRIRMAEDCNVLNWIGAISADGVILEREFDCIRTAARGKRK